MRAKELVTPTDVTGGDANISASGAYAGRGTAGSSRDHPTGCTVVRCWCKLHAPNWAEYLGAPVIVEKTPLRLIDAGFGMSVKVFKPMIASPRRRWPQ